MKRYKAGLIFLAVFMNTGCNDNQEKDKTEPLSDTCYLTPDPGLCMAAFPRYYYDSDAEQCKEFIWGGCGGVVPFETMADCKEGCVN